MNPLTHDDIVELTAPFLSAEDLGSLQVSNRTSKPYADSVLRNSLIGLMRARNELDRRERNEEGIREFYSFLRSNWTLISLSDACLTSPKRSMCTFIESSFSEEYFKISGNPPPVLDPLAFPNANPFDLEYMSFMERIRDIAFPIYKAQDERKDNMDSNQRCRSIGHDWSKSGPELTLKAREITKKFEKMQPTDYEPRYHVHVISIARKIAKAVTVAFVATVAVELFGVYRT